MAYTKSRLTLKLSKCKQSGPYELLSSCRLPAPSKHIRAAFSLSGSECKRCGLARTHVLLIKNIYEYILNFFSKIIIFITTKLVFDDFFSNSQLFTFTITSSSLSSTRLYMRSVIRYLFNVGTLFRSIRFHFFYKLVLFFEWQSSPLRFLRHRFNL